MRKGIADLKRRTEVSQAINNRYLDALASIEDTTALGDLTRDLCRPTSWKGRRVRAMQPWSPADLELLRAVAQTCAAHSSATRPPLRSVPPMALAWTAQFIALYIDISGFGLAMALTGWGLWRMEIQPVWKAYLLVCWLYLISNVFTLAKMLRDAHEADLAEARLQGRREAHREAVAAAE